MHRSRPPHPARLLAAVFALLAGALAAPACRDAGPAPPLLLLVTTDTLRADHVGAWGDGGPPGITPNLDALARDAVRFRSAWAPASYTLPSVAAMHTGRYPEEVGILANRNLFRGSSVTLAEVLRLGGWRTAAAVSNYVLRAGTGIEKGFELYDDEFTQVEANRAQPERTAPPTTDAALALFDRLRQQPAAGVFLWVHYQDPHGPYVPPASYRERFLDWASRAPDAKRELPSQGINPIGAIPSYQLVDGRHDVGFYRAGYAGEVHFFDAEFGRLLEGLRERGALEDAVIVFTADHGESLGENDYWFAHGEYLSNELVRVPLLVRAPGLEPGTRDDIASLVDLLPTLLALRDIDAPGSFPGRNLFAAGAPEAKGHAYLATLMGASKHRYGWVEDGYKYVMTPIGDGRAAETLVRIDAPGRDVAADEPERTLHMRERLRRFRAGLTVPEAVEQELSPRDREMLRRLGYLE